MHVLLVEDNPADARLIYEALREVPELKVELSHVSTLNEAKDGLRDGFHADVALLDLGLPDAVETQAVRDLGRLAPALPIVVLTGLDDGRTALKAMREGAQDYLLKSQVQPAPLARAMQLAIERKKVQTTEHLMAEIALILTSTLEYNLALQRLSAMAARSLGDFCVLDMVAEDGSIRRLQVAERNPGMEDLLGRLLRHPLHQARPPLRDILATRKAVRVCDIPHSHLEAIAENEDHLAILEELAPRSYIAVPLQHRDQLIGTILFVATSRNFTQGDQDLAEKIGRIASPEIANALLYQRAQDAIRGRDRVLRMVAHDLKNPLSTISMSAELLLEPDLKPEVRARQLHVIRRSTDRMDRLIQDLLDVARIESDQLQLAPAYQNPGLLAQEAVELNLAVAASRGLILEPEIESPEIGPVKADRGRILQVLSNLIGNAVKYTPEGGTIRVRVYSAADEVLFAVSDEGPGIAPEDREHLFTPFLKGRRSVAEGAGLGLSIAKGIVDAHGGRIWIDEHARSGATITFSLPRQAERRSAGDPRGTGLPSAAAGESIGIPFTEEPDDRFLLPPLLESLRCLT